MTNTHTFQVDLAVRYGLEEAILLEWLAHNLTPEAAGDAWYARGGESWLRLSIRQLQAEFPYLSGYVLKRSLACLEANCLVKSDTEDTMLGLRKSKYTSYALTPKGSEVCGGEAQ